MVSKNENTYSPPSKRWRQRGCGCLLVPVLLLLLYYGAYFVSRGALPSDPQLIAHRGGPVYAPENTLSAFRNAIEAGTDWLEMDVQMTKDGALVVIHDENVDRTTNGSGNVKDLTLEQIRALDAGNGEQVPTFDEVITLARETGVGIMPEAKSPHLYPGIEAKMVQMVVEADFIENSVIQSFDPQVLDSIEALNPDVQVCPLYGLWTLSLSGPQPGEADVICPMAEMIILNPWMIKQAHAEGRKVFVWFGVIEHPAVMRFILSLGADGLMVDDPVALVHIAGR